MDGEIHVAGRLLSLFDRNKLQVVVLEVERSAIDQIVLSVNSSYHPLTLPTGETLCDEKSPIILEKMDFPDPVIKIAIEPKSKADLEKMGMGLNKLAQEDPSFGYSRDEETNQTVIEGMVSLQPPPNHFQPRDAEQASRLPPIFKRITPFLTLRVSSTWRSLWTASAASSRSSARSERLRSTTARESPGRPR